MNYTLNIGISDNYIYLIKILLFDADNSIVEIENTSVNKIFYSLPKGLYTLRIDLNGEIKDEVIFLDKDLSFFVTDNRGSAGNTKIISPPAQYSSALLGNIYRSSHEYYTYPAIDNSKKDTFSIDPNNVRHLNSSLFVFLRFPSGDIYRKCRDTFSKPFFHYFKIIGEDGEIVIDFKNELGIVFEMNDGWVAFNALLPDGVYYLTYDGEEERQIPIYVFKYWHTQFFMTLGKQPLFGSARIFLSQNREFNPDDHSYKYIDILLDKLQNNDFSLDKQLIETAAYGKFESPMLGLICSYIYLKSSETKNDGLFRVITQNLQNIILRDNLESPDLLALNILAADHFPNYKIPEVAAQGTPMFRIGFEAILKASVKNNSLIPQYSINDLISENLFYDSPFSTFKPIPFIKKSRYRPLNILGPKGTDDNIKINYIKIRDIPKIDTDNLLVNESSIPTSKDYSKKILDLYGDGLFTFIKDSNNPKVDDSWIKNSIIELVKEKKNISINEISSQLSVSGNTINRILGEWDIELKKFLDKGNLGDRSDLNFEKY